MGIARQSDRPKLSGFAKKIHKKFKRHCKEIIDLKHILRYLKTKKNQILINIEKEMNFKGSYFQQEAQPAS